MGSDDLATYGFYLDQNKDRLDQQIPGSRKWHYENVPVCGSEPHSEYCPGGLCVSTQVLRNRDVLADARESKAHKQFAIWVLTHLIGDIHQPLHAADNADRGGNEIRIRLPWGRKANLHGAWDTELVEYSFGGRNEVNVAKDLVQKFALRKVDWQIGTVQSWSDDSHQLAKRTAYGKIPGFACGVDLKQMRISLSQEYVDTARTVIEEQLAKAGYRLAYVLTQALGNDLQ